MKRTLFVGLTVLMLTACFSIPKPPALPTLVPAVVPSSVIPTDTPTSSTVETVSSPQPTDFPLPAGPLPDVTGFPNSDDYYWEPVAFGLQRPVDIQNAGDGSGRLFIIEKAGRVRILQNGQILTSPFLDISIRVGSRGNEQGLLGLAFHPQYAENGLFFVNYTDKDGNTVIARFQVTSDPNIASPASETVLLHITQPFANHNGGVLAFGPDGYLYAGLGDGGSGGDPYGNAQNPDTFLGKILRLDVDNGVPYGIPPENRSGGEIWAYGLRNPWRLSFDRATGNLFIADVGQNQWEEIDYIPAGYPDVLNFGWNYMEGTHPYQGSPPLDLVLNSPVAEYGHDQGCSVTGGYVYRGAMPEWQGVYFYADYCQGLIWGLIGPENGLQNRLLFGVGVPVTSFGQDEAGELYLASDSGQILKFVTR